MAQESECIASKTLTSLLDQPKVFQMPNHTAAQAELIALAEQLVRQPDLPFNLSDLTVQLGVSESQVQRRFVKAFGISPKALQSAARLGKFKTALRAGKSVLDAIIDAGFGSTSRLYGEPDRDIGMTPTSYARGALGEHIVWTAGITAFGYLLLAATDRGICFAQFDDRKAKLLQQLHDEFPHATIAESTAKNSASLRQWWLAIERHLQQQQPMPDLPLDLRGTAFQIKVWRFLQQTQAGQTISYGELAAGIAQPKAVRAAASACAKNKVALLVPCHRVLRGDGQIGGYRWGVARKQRLLQMEAKLSTTRTQVR